METFSEKIREIDNELAQINKQIEKLKSRKSELCALKQSILSQKIEAEAEKLAAKCNWESSTESRLPFVVGHGPGF